MRPGCVRCFEEARGKLQHALIRTANTTNRQHIRTKAKFAEVTRPDFLAANPENPQEWTDTYRNGGRYRQPMPSFLGRQQNDGNSRLEPRFKKTTASTCWLHVRADY